MVYNVANEIDYEFDGAWTSIHGIHDNGPRDHGVWRLTLTAYNVKMTLPWDTALLHRPPQLLLEEARSTFGRLGIR